MRLNMQVCNLIVIQATSELAYVAQGASISNMYMYLHAALGAIVLCIHIANADHADYS